MIAYDELAAALERWRCRQGLPATAPLFSDDHPPPRAQVVPAAPAPAPGATQAPRTPPPPPSSSRATIMGMVPPNLVPPTMPGVPGASITGVAPPAPPPPPTPAANAVAAIPAGASNRATIMGMAPPHLAPPAMPGAPAPIEVDEAEPTRGGHAPSSADGWIEARTVASSSLRPPPRHATMEVDDAGEATEIGELTRHD